MRASRNFILISQTIFFLFLTSPPAYSQSDPQGVRDSLYVECSQSAGDILLLQIRFTGDNTDSNRIAGFGLPFLVTVSNNALVLLDTTEATTFAGSIISRFALKTTDTDSTGGADPSVSPVHYVLGGITFDSGATGTGLFATVKLTLNGDSCTVSLDTLSTLNLSPLLVTETAQSFKPGWPPAPSICQATDVVDLKRGIAGNIPTDFRLNQNYPNPFNASSTIQFELPRQSRVLLEIFNGLGQLVKTLVDEELSPGYKQVIWDGTDGRGKRVASGVYFIRLKAGEEFSQMRKMVLLK